VVTRTSTGVQSTPVSNPSVTSATQSATPHSRTHHPVLTSASGAGSGGRSDD
jgi:hypothetical protein